MSVRMKIGYGAIVVFHLLFYLALFGFTVGMIIAGLIIIPSIGLAFYITITEEDE